MAKHQERKYQCDQCDYKAVYNCNLEKHKKSIHETKKEQVPIKEEKEKMHLLTQSGEKVLKRPSKLHYCDQCSYQATKNKYLEKHIQVTHSINRGVKQITDFHEESATRRKSKKYSCSKCSYQATKPKYVVNHKKSVHGEEDKILGSALDVDHEGVVDKQAGPEDLKQEIHPEQTN